MGSMNSKTRRFHQIAAPQVNANVASSATPAAEIAGSLHGPTTALTSGLSAGTPSGDGEVRMFRIQETVLLEVRGKRISPQAKIISVRPAPARISPNSQPSPSQPSNNVLQRQRGRQKSPNDSGLTLGTVENGLNGTQRTGHSGFRRFDGSSTSPTTDFDVSPSTEIDAADWNNDGGSSQKASETVRRVSYQNNKNTLSEDDDEEEEDEDYEEDEVGSNQFEDDQSSTDLESTLDDAQLADDDDGDDVVDLSQTDDLPDVDTPEAANISCIRLRAILFRLKRGVHVAKPLLIANLSYVSDVLETVYANETRRLCDEPETLSVAETKNVPVQVRDWLTMTFTRSASSLKRNKQEIQHRFRNVANVIRAGIVVERIYRRMSSGIATHIPAHIQASLQNLDEWTFDVFALNDAASDGNLLKYVAYEIMRKNDVMNKFRISSNKLENFLTQIATGYGKYSNPYHNQSHAADVTQTTHYLLNKTGLVNWLSDLEIFAALTAAVVHDYEHTGTTNAFHINTSSDIALLYNDRNVLENHHVSAAFRMMLSNEDSNILASMKAPEYKEFRMLVVEIVLATDMSLHFQQVKTMRSLISLPESVDKCKALSLIVHTADISHPAKTWNLHYQWTNLLVQEFFRQGDREAELSLPISPLCDRRNTLVAESQIGFIDFIVDPSFQVMSDVIDKILDSTQQQQPTAVASSQPPNSLGRISDKRLSIKTFRPWTEHLVNNKRLWKEKSQKAAEEGKTEAANEDKRNDKPENKDINGVADDAKLVDEKVTATGTAVSDVKQQASTPTSNRKIERRETLQSSSSVTSLLVSD